MLVSQRFTEPFRDPITYGRSIAKLANLLGDGILVQRLADLKAGRRSTAERIAQYLTALVVVGGCTIAFMVGAITAYDPSRGLIRRGPAGGEA